MPGNLANKGYIPDVPLDSSKSHRRSQGHMSKYACDPEMAQNSNRFISARNIDHVSKPRVSSLFFSSKILLSYTFELSQGTPRIQITMSISCSGLEKPKNQMK